MNDATVILMIPDPIERSVLFEYLVWVLLALLVFGFLVYSLFRPEKF
jgi:K+-transporting ATPase KdpF subunit